MSASQLRASARKSLAGKWGKAVLVTLCYLLIMMAIEFILGKIPVIGEIVNIIISVPITYGIITSFVKLKREEELTYIGFLEEGFSNFSKAWGIFGHTALKMIIPIILMIISILLIVVSTNGVIFSGNMLQGTNLGTFLGMGIVALVVFVISIIYSSVKGLLYILTNFILYDNPNMTSKEIVQESERLMKGNRWRYAWLELTFIGWMILCSFTFGIGLLWLIPYLEVTVVCFYEVLSGKDSNEQSEEIIEENNPISE